MDALKLLKVLPLRAVTCIVVSVTHWPKLEVNGAPITLKLKIKPLSQVSAGFTQSSSTNHMDISLVNADNTIDRQRFHMNILLWNYRGISN